MVWDCADGQLARATNQSSPLGRFYDGICDMLVIATYTSILCVSSLRHNPELYDQGGDWFWYWLTLIVCASLQQHFILFDKVKIVYTLQTTPKNDKSRKEFEDCINKTKLQKLLKQQTGLWGKVRKNPQRAKSERRRLAKERTTMVTKRGAERSKATRNIVAEELRSSWRSSSLRSS